MLTYLSHDFSSNNLCDAGDALMAFKDTIMYTDYIFESWSNISTNNSPCAWQFVQCDDNGNVQEL